MITLAIMRQMAADNVAGLTIDEDFFWEELPLWRNGEPAQGTWCVTRGGSAINTPHGINQKTTIDFYVAKNNKMTAEAIQAAIATWIRANRVICALSGAVGDDSYSFQNIRITPATTPQNSGATENGNIVKMASANVVYDIGTNSNN